jgi:hypothetical protein
MNALKLTAVATLAALTLSACSDNDDKDPVADPRPVPQLPSLPQLSPAVGATLAACTELATRINYPEAVITAASSVAAGTLTIGGKPVGAHCLVTGQLQRRTSPVDGQAYAIGFEMRLPSNWNGRFFYQANGGVDGSVVQATGPVGGGGPSSASTRRPASTMVTRRSAS